MPAKLNQIIAIEKGVKSSAFQELTDAHHQLQKPALLSGISRTYQPKDEEGEQFPPEFTKVQVTAEAVAKDTAKILTKLFDVTARRDSAGSRPALRTSSFLAEVAQRGRGSDRAKPD